jgi:hypothetical protein
VRCARALAITILSLAPAAAAADSPPGLMVHVPLDGTVVDTRGLGAVRADPAGAPTFIAGPSGEAALPAPGHRRVGMLHVSRLSRLLLRGRTPEAGTIMLWVRRPERPESAAAAADTTPVLVLSSGAPLNLDVALGGTPPRLVAAFDDDSGARHEISTPLAAGDSWVHVALGWDAHAGTTVAFVQGAAQANDTGSPFVMPGLPKVFALGAPDTPIDDFRLYDRLLDPAALKTLPGLAAAAP